MESLRLPYKQDAFGNSLYARVAWSKSHQGKKGIALVFHGGGLMVGSDQIIPAPQVKYLADQGFAVVMPNYRLAPQVTATEAFGDCEDAYDWAANVLPGLLKSEQGIELDSSRTVAMGHSSGGSLALHMASLKPILAATAFYPSLYTADRSSSIYEPMTAPPFGAMPDFVPSDEDWASIKPEGRQISEAAMALPGSVPRPRNRWQMHVLKHGLWLDAVQPDGNCEAIDPLTRLSSKWAPIMIVQGDLDNVPGSSLELAQHAEKDMKKAGVKEVQLEVVPGEMHMFDLPPAVGTTDLGPKWQAVLKGLDWLISHI